MVVSVARGCISASVERLLVEVGVYIVYAASGLPTSLGATFISFQTVNVKSPNTHCSLRSVWPAHFP